MIAYVNTQMDRDANRAAIFLRRVFMHEAPVSTPYKRKKGSRSRTRGGVRRRPGTLRNGHKVVKEKDMSYKVQNRVPYGFYVHEGTKHHRGNPWMTRGLKRNKIRVMSMLYPKKIQ